MARVLVIEDDDAVRSLVIRMLERVGHEVVATPDGREALRLFGQEPTDLVITDINMPGMDGIEVISAFRAMRAGVPIIAISGGGLMPKELLLSSAAAMGAVEVVSKPFEISRLVGAVDRALRQQPREED
jgi:CheY-like chemotaxis protein